MNIQVVDNFLPDQIHKEVFKQTLNLPYLYGETDHAPLHLKSRIDPLGEYFNKLNPVTVPPIGIVSDIEDGHYLRNIFSDAISDKFPEILDKKIYRMYVNCFFPCDKPNYHIDGSKGKITFLYYPHIYWNYDDGGETCFISKDSNEQDQIYGILPIPNRIIKFSAELVHKATSFRDTARFTIAIKYE